MCENTRPPAAAAGNRTSGRRTARGLWRPVSAFFARGRGGLRTVTATSVRVQPRPENFSERTNPLGPHLRIRRKLFRSTARLDLTAAAVGDKCAPNDRGKTRGTGWTSNKPHKPGWSRLQSRWFDVTTGEATEERTVLRGEAAEHPTAGSAAQAHDVWLGEARDHWAEGGLHPSQRSGPERRPATRGYRCGPRVHWAGVRQGCPLPPSLPSGLVLFVTVTP